MRAFLFSLLWVIPLAVNADSVTIRGNDDGPGAKGPLTTVSWERQTGGVLVLINSQMEEESYREYGVHCSTFVKGERFLDQVSTPALPHGLGGLIPSTLASPPFDVHVVCEALSPKNARRTVVPVTVTSQRLVGKVDCTLTLTTAIDGGDDESEIFSASGLTTSQSGENAFSLSFDGEAADASGTVTVATSATVNLTDNSTTGTISITRDGEAETHDVTGAVVIKDESLGSFDLTSSDEAVKLSCL